MLGNVCRGSLEIFGVNFTGVCVRKTWQVDSHGLIRLDNHDPTFGKAHA